MLRTCAQEVGHALGGQRLRPGQEERVVGGVIRGHQAAHSADDRLEQAQLRVVLQVELLRHPIARPAAQGRRVTTY